MQDVKVVLNRKGVRELLTSQEVTDDLKRRGDAISERAGAYTGGAQHYAVEAHRGRQRSRVGIITATEDAMIDEAYHRTLTSALDAGRQ